MSRVCTGLKGSAETTRRKTEVTLFEVSHTPTYFYPFLVEKTNLSTPNSKVLEQGIVGFVISSGSVTLTAPDLFSWFNSVHDSVSQT